MRGEVVGREGKRGNEEWEAKWPQEKDDRWAEEA